MDDVTEVMFEIGDHKCALTYDDASIFSEQLLSYHRDVYMKDVNRLASHGTDPGWVEGGESLSRRIEAVLTTAESRPIVLDAKGKEGDAAFHALRLSGPVSFDATSARACLYRALEEARRPSGLRAVIARIIGR